MTHHIFLFKKKNKKQKTKIQKRKRKSQTRWLATGWFGHPQADHLGAAEPPLVA
jgi:hypothetical protein